MCQALAWEFGSSFGLRTLSSILLRSHDLSIRSPCPGRAQMRCNDLPNRCNESVAEVGMATGLLLLCVLNHKTMLPRQRASKDALVFSSLQGKRGAAGLGDFSTMPLKSVGCGVGSCLPSGPAIAGLVQIGCVLLSRHVCRCGETAFLPRGKLHGWKIQTDEEKRPASPPTHKPHYFSPGSASAAGLFPRS